MTPRPNRAEPLSPVFNDPDVLELGRDQAVEPAFDPDQWAESRAEAHGAGGRQVLAATLIVLAALWLAFTAWSAGRALPGQPLRSPQIAPRGAVAAGPLALPRLARLVFRRTRRKEAE